MSNPQEIISDLEIDHIHWGNFGPSPKRDVVDEGVLKYALGFHSGNTQMQILIEHGLIRKPKPGQWKSTLTQKGFEYLRAVYGPYFRQMVDLPKAEGGAE